MKTEKKQSALAYFNENMRIKSCRTLALLFISVVPVMITLSSCKNGKMSKDESALRARALSICKNNLLLDSHIDWPEKQLTDPEDIAGRVENGDFDYERAVTGGLNTVFSVAYINSEYDVNKGRTIVDSMLSIVKYTIEKHPDRFAPALTPENVKKNFKEGLISLPVCLENGSPLGNSLEYLKYLKEKGIVYVTLCHDRTNDISDSNFDQERRWNGLSPFGREVIREMNRLGLMIDISHSTDSAAFQALQYSVAPVVATHSSCRELVPGLERNLPDTLIKAIAQKNGVVMVNFGSYFLEPECLNNWVYLMFQWPDSTGIEPFSAEWSDFMVEFGKTHRLRSDAAMVAEHIDHIVKLVGIDHVGIGSDLDGVDNAQPDNLPDVSAYPVLVYELLKMGYTENDLQKILSENFLRVWADVLAFAD